ncbi:hypothetical protein DM01DRAFT_1379821 [Hesseltinella vesiculosa]|uniref:protein-tyrosine-phosphatase n=1 Tax=Hesseltinella vesiculosa TaxID=101127 RepID=A0A1X2GWG1_9FUNG|nr:hypothetical protein DM01DRAFT_1379821 [Hesseltinella vesiculosa]
MSIAFESPTRRGQGNEYFTPLSMPPSLLNHTSNDPDLKGLHAAIPEESSSTGGTTPYFTAPINPILHHQDFFNAIHQRQANQSSVFTPTLPNLAEKPPTLPNGSIADRRRKKQLQLQQQNNPMPPQLRTPSSPYTPSSPLHTNGLQLVQPILPLDLRDQLQQQEQQPGIHLLLLVDVRSFIQFSQARIRGAINISIPHTILKRPTFTMDKVYEAIVDADRARLKQWPSYDAIVFCDQASTLMQSPCAISFLSQKLVQAGYQGHLYYLHGGFDAFRKQQPDLCITSPPKKANGLSLGALPTFHGKNGMKTPHLPLANGHHPGHSVSSIGPFTAPMPVFENQCFNPFFSNIRQNMELAHGPIKERFPLRLPPHCTPALADDGTLTVTLAHTQPMPRCVAGARLEQHADGKMVFIAPSWLQQTMIDDKTQQIGTVSLAQLYEKLERTEQQRLQNIMHFHSNDTETSNFPLSIVAGIEMGALNRYTNIWPFEYTRVKIHDTPSGSTGYINASFIQYVPPFPAHQSNTICQSNGQSPVTPTKSPQHVNPACVSVMQSSAWQQQPYRRYISTQGPLPSTFDDFWQVVWEQNCRVVVMLTKEEEMNKIKCHRYWPSSLHQTIEYGTTSLTLVNEKEHPLTGQASDDVIVEREFLVEKRNQPSRSMTQLHYTGWLDYGVPDTPLGTLELVHLADQIQNQYEAQQIDDNVGPMLIHCSAGCGRSGAFCAIDTVIRRLTRFNNYDLDQDALWDIIYTFRQQRLSMVQTLRQFVFCYEAVWWWFLGYGQHA